MWKHLAGLLPNPNDMQTDDPELYTSKIKCLAPHAHMRAHARHTCSALARAHAHARIRPSAAPAPPPHYAHTFARTHPCVYTCQPAAQPPAWLRTRVHRYVLENSVEGLDMTFTDEQLDAAGRLKEARMETRTPRTHARTHAHVQVELKPRGGQIEVTDQNKREYVALLSHHRLKGAELSCDCGCRSVCVSVHLPRPRPPPKKIKGCSMY